MKKPGKASQSKYDLVIEKDVEIPVRDGARLKADIFRPKSGGRFPVIMNIGGYRKDKLWVPPADLEEEANPYMNWESVNPLWWIPRGYIAIRVDTRGSGKSPGMFDPWSRQEAVDFYDCIEWAAKRGWCNGRVGLSGISYFAMNQWLVAGLQPPSLKAIIPWEGAADMYRDLAYHGGLFCLGFVANWFNNHMAHHLLGSPQQHNPDAFSNNWLWQYMRHNLDTGWFDQRRAAWDRIKVPMLSAGNWSGMGLHLRGNTEGYLRAASRHKKLRIHAGTHYHPFYSEDGRRDQLRFFDHWLKGVDTGFMDEPPVRLLIRKGGAGNYEWRAEKEWPLKRTRWTRFYLAPAKVPVKGRDPAEGHLAVAAPRRRGALAYSAAAMSKAGVASASWTSTALPGSLPRLGISFETPPLREDLEVVGPAVLTLWVSSSTEDLDLFVTLRNIDRDGGDVWEIGQQQQNVPVAKGWLRASHRKLDPKLSLPFRPYHSHDERLLLRRNTPVKVEVEIWPTCMVFRKGHRVRLDIQPRDGLGSAPYTHYSADYNVGQNIVHTGGSTASHLLLPVIPRK
ncbi:MAG: CocE/NonD family hydrolase [Betaproteobacteria bacterium]|nr:CocE/NonD family hydrolase [Betaproteobacteria bacterium]